MDFGFDVPEPVNENSISFAEVVDLTMPNAVVGSDFTMSSAVETPQDTPYANVDPVGSFAGIAGGTNPSENFLATDFGMATGVGAGRLNYKINEDISNLNYEGAWDKEVTSGGDVRAVNEFLQSSAYDEAKDLVDGVKSYYDPYDKRDKDNTEGVLTALGLTNTLSTQGKYGGSDTYTYNPETNQFELTWEGEKSAAQAYAGPLIQAGVSAAFTAGIGSAISSSAALANMSTQTANAIGQGVASGLTTAATGGNTEDILLSSALGGLGGYADGVEEAQQLAQANVENLTAIANSGVAGQSLIAQSQLASATSALNEINATAELVNTITTTVDLAEAIDQKDALGIVNGALSLANMSSSQDLLSDKIKDTYQEGSFVFDNADLVSSVSVESLAEIAEGGDIKDVVQTAAGSVVKQTVLSDMNVKTAIQDVSGSNEFIANNIDAFTAATKAAGFSLLDGKNREKIIRDTFDAYRKAGGQLTPETEDSKSPDFLKNIEKWYHENIENPLEAWWQEIEPTREMFEGAVQGAIDAANQYVVQPVVNVVEGIIEGADQVVRDLPTTKEDWEELEDTIKQAGSDFDDATFQVVKDNVVDPVVGAIRGTGRAVEEVYDAAEGLLPDEVPFEVEGDVGVDQRTMEFMYDDSDLVTNRLLPKQEQRIRSLTDALAFEQAQEQEVRRAQTLADEDERIKRAKAVYSPRVGATVTYTG
jgi:hypothetical protein